MVDEIVCLELGEFELVGGGLGGGHWRGVNLLVVRWDGFMIVFGIIFELFD